MSNTRSHQMGDSLTLIISGYFSWDLLMDGEVVVGNEVIDWKDLTDEQRERLTAGGRP